MNGWCPNPKFAASMLQGVANFGIGTLVLRRLAFA